MSQLVPFGMNKFRRPNVFALGKTHDLRTWREETRARVNRRREEEGALIVNGQELTPQRQRQELISKVESAKRPALVQIFNSVFPERHVKLEQVIDAAEPTTRTPKSRRQLAAKAAGITELELRERLKATILMADTKQLRPIIMLVNSLARDPTMPGSAEIANYTEDRVNYASREEILAMHEAITKIPRGRHPEIDQIVSRFPKQMPDRLESQEEVMRANLRMAILVLRSKPELMNRICVDMLAAADQAAVRNDTAPKVA